MWLEQRCRRSLPTRAGGSHPLPLVGNTLSSVTVAESRHATIHTERSASHRAGAPCRSNGDNTKLHVPMAAYRHGARNPIADDLAVLVKAIRDELRLAPAGRGIQEDFETKHTALVRRSGGRVLAGRVLFIVIIPLQRGGSGAQSRVK